jgi:hypothetical protein
MVGADRPALCIRHAVGEDRANRRCECPDSQENRPEGRWIQLDFCSTGTFSARTRRLCAADESRPAALRATNLATNFD